MKIEKLRYNEKDSYENLALDHGSIFDTLVWLKIYKYTVEFMEFMAKGMIL